jgi:glycosyltransferase involved in cell wall biosynthesis
MVPFDEVPAFLKAADLFGFASITETQGLVTMEALAAGLPVVAVDAPGTRDIIQNQEQGYLVENDPQALAGAIGRLLGNRDLYNRMRASTKERLKDFDMSTLAGKLTDVYQQAIQDKKAGQYVRTQ